MRIPYRKFLTTSVVILVSTATISVAFAGGIKPPEMDYAIAHFSQTVPVSAIPSATTCTGKDGDQYGTTNLTINATSVDDVGTGDFSLNGPVTVHSKATVNEGTVPGRAGRGIASGTFLLKPATTPDKNDRLVGTFNLVVQALSLTHTLGRGFVIAKYFVFSPKLGKFVWTGDTLYANSEVDVTVDNSDPNPANWTETITTTLGNDLAQDNGATATLPVLGVKAIGSCA